MGTRTNDLTEFAKPVADELAARKEHTDVSTQKAEEKVEMPLFAAEQLSLSENERSVFGCLSAEPIHIEDIIAQTELAAGSINASLIALRLKGLIKQLPGNSFLRNR